MKLTRNYGLILIINDKCDMQNILEITHRYLKFRSFRYFHRVVPHKFYFTILGVLTPTLIQRKLCYLAICIHEQCKKIPDV